MKRISRYQYHSLLLIFLLFILLPGCAPVISKNLRAQADLSLTFQQVFQNPEAYKGKIVIWGGEIIETINQRDKTTLIEVLERPLDWTEEPKITKRSRGRFLVLAEGYLDPYIFRRGRELTVAGEILGEKSKLLAEMEYRYPLLLSKQIYLWGMHYYYHYPPPYYPYYPGGWRWGYPYRW
jgi:outer membrane lipoprotein